MGDISSASPVTPVIAEICGGESCDHIPLVVCTPVGEPTVQPRATRRGGRPKGSKNKRPKGGVSTGAGSRTRARICDGSNTAQFVGLGSVTVHAASSWHELMSRLDESVQAGDDTESVNGEQLASHYQDFVQSVADGIANHRIVQHISVPDVAANILQAFGGTTMERPSHAAGHDEGSASRDVYLVGESACSHLQLDVMSAPGTGEIQRTVFI